MISLKKASFNDIDFLWYLRNQPDVYKYFREAKPISLEEHIKWITPIISGKAEKELLVIYKDEIPVGQIRFDYKDKKAEISISILKEFREKGLATSALGKAVSRQKDRILLAKIHKDNIGSIKLFEKLNFKLKQEKKKWLEYILK